MKSGAPIKNPGPNFDRDKYGFCPVRDVVPPPGASVTAGTVIKVMAECGPDDDEESNPQNGNRQTEQREEDGK